MKKSTFVLFAVAIWVITVFSLIAVRYLIRRAPQVSAYSQAAKAYFDSLDDFVRSNISVLETAVIRLEDGSFRVIGAGFEPELEDLISERRLLTREIDFFIENPIAIERKMMAGEAFKTLNNAEKKCFIDGYGAILFRSGSYRFLCDNAIYQVYVKKYGTKCRPCEEMKKRSNAKQGGNNGQ